MNTLILHRRRMLLLLAAVPAACSSPDPHLYTLAATTGAVRSGGPKVVALRSISLARYLERPQIVRSSEDFRLDLLSNDWWGEPLGPMFGRIMVQDLTQRVPGTTIYPENGAISSQPDATIGINIQRLDADRSGAVLLIAQVSVMDRSVRTRTVTTSVVPESPSTASLVAAMSTAVGRLADDAAALLVGG